ncbi:MAG: methyltransferase domain-containing protein [Flavobacteriales bacterium]
MEKAWFKEWFGTPYYALLYGNRDEQEAKAQVDGALALTGLKPGDHVLDMACGRGRHVRWFTERGMRVTGFDVNADAITAARRAAPGADLHVHDMRAPFAEGAFDLVVNLFTSFGYFEKRSDDLLVLRAVHTALKPGGSLLIDFMNTPKVIAGLVAKEERAVGEVRFTMTRRVHEGMVEKSIRVSDRGIKHQYMERVMALTPEEIVSMAEQCGFRVAGRFGDFEGNPYDVERSERFVLWVKRWAA